VPSVHARITLLATGAGGRKSGIDASQGYRPHVRVDDGEMLGVEVVGGDRSIAPGASAVVDLELLYDIDYSSLSPGATFSIVEGLRRVEN
jgi:hypothetical protein